MSYYRDVYLKSEHWQTLRRNKARHSKKLCAACGAEGPLDTHHLVYLNLKDIRNTHLRRVCRRCHDAIHELKARGMLNFKTKNLNGIWAGTQARLLKVFGITHANGITPAREPWTDLDVDLNRRLRTEP